MSKQITIEPELERAIVDMCDDELHYHIKESGYAEEYASEISVQIRLLEKLGYSQKAKQYQEQFQSYMTELGNGRFRRR